MFKPAITDPEQIKAILQKSLTATADGGSNTTSTTPANSRKDEEREEFIKDDRSR
jgi:hypothetical protein